MFELVGSSCGGSAVSMIDDDDGRNSIPSNLPSGMSTPRYQMGAANPSDLHAPSLTRQLAFGHLEAEIPKTSTNAFFDYRTNLCAKVGSCIIIGITVALFLVFWFKNRQLEARWSELSAQEAARHSTTTLPSTLPPSTLSTTTFLNSLIGLRNETEITDLVSL